jgi:hypothetical protein
MQIVMVKVGRKRKFRGTVPGRLNVRPESAGELAAAQPHRRTLPPALRLAAEAETPFGRLYLAGAYDVPGDPERGWRRHEAGQRYKTIALAYLASIGSPRDGLPHGKSYPCTGAPRCGLGQGEPACECRARKVAYNSAFEALAEVGHRAQVEVAHVAVHGRVCGNLDYLLVGLDALAHHLLTDKPKNGRL